MAFKSNDNQTNGSIHGPRRGNPQSHLRTGKERLGRLSQTTDLQGHGLAPTGGSGISALRQSMPELGNRSPQTR